MTVLDVFACVRRHTAVFSLTALLGGALIAVALLTFTTMYEASALLVFDGVRNARSNDSDIMEKSRTEQILRTQAAIVTSEAVLSQAVASFGAANLLKAANRERGDAGAAQSTKEGRSGGSKGDLLSEAARLLGGLASEADARLEDRGSNADQAEAALQLVTKQLTATIEPNTVIIRISFRHADPGIAAAFVNKVVDVFMETNSRLSKNPFAAQFFKEQAEEFRVRAAQAQNRLRDFMERTKSYSIEQERDLLLKRRDIADKDLAATAGDIQKVQAELDSMRMQLASLRTTIRLPPEIFGSNSFPGSGRETVGQGDPPLLHVKIYQETAQEIVKANASLAGLKSLDQFQRRIQSDINRRLIELASAESEFNRLKGEVDDAQTHMASFVKRGAEAQVDDEWRSNEQLSSTRLIQSATEPRRAAYPKPVAVILGAAGGGIAAGLLLALAVDQRQRRRQHQLASGLPPLGDRERVRAGAGGSPGIPVGDRAIG